MNYNDAHFEFKVIEKLNKKIEMLMKCEAIVLNSIKCFLMATNGHQQIENFESFIQLIVKMRFNIESAHTLMPLLKVDYRFKTSINVLYRSSLDDIINIYYLLKFVIMENSGTEISNVQTSLGNELDILHRDFLKSISKVVEAEIEAEKYFQDSDVNNESRPFTWRKEMIESNLHLFNQQKNDWKNNKEIRIASHGIFKNKYPSGNSFISESAKIDFIITGGFKRGFILTKLFKYFSQFQHFSPKMHQFLLSNAENDLEYYHKQLIEILCVVIECNQIITTDQKQVIEDMVNADIVLLIKLYNEYITLEDSSSEQE